MKSGRSSGSVDSYEHINYLIPVITIDQQQAMAKRMRREDEDGHDDDDDNSGIVSVLSCWLL